MSRTSQRILIIEDDPDIAMMMKMMLEYHEYSIVIASPEINKIDELLLNDHFDLVIMDMLLSGINGLDVCERIKKDKQLAELPVIMISAHPNARDLALNASADDFISKPFDMTDLLYKIKSLISLND